MNDKIYTSDEILAMETESVSGLGEMPITYQLTEGEWEWVLFVKGKYCIADYIISHSYLVPDTENTYIVTMDSYHISESLDGDNKGAGMAAMLSEDSALQRIFFCVYTESDDE